MLLSYLLQHNYKELIKIINRALNIDTLSRVMDDNRVNWDTKNKSRRIREMRNIDKALAMELLMSLLLTYLDDSEQVICNCVEQNNLPNNFAASDWVTSSHSILLLMMYPHFRACLKSASYVDRQ